MSTVFGFEKSRAFASRTSLSLFVFIFVNLSFSRLLVVESPSIELPGTVEGIERLIGLQRLDSSSAHQT